MHRNINRLLENAKRSDVRGYNIYTRGKQDLNRMRKEDNVLQQWDQPSFGLAGMAAIAHEIEQKDLIIPKIFINGTEVEFDVVRNHWTPAFMDTYYRSKPFGAYERNGVVAVREQKCFDDKDTFISHLTFCNDGQEPLEVNIRLQVPFEQISEEQYRVYTKIMPASLGKDLFLEGFACAKTQQGAVTSFTIPPLESVKIRYGFAFHSESAKKAQEAVEFACTVSDPFIEAEQRFNAWMNTYVPKLTIENQDLLKIYYYRFFVIKCAIHTPSDVWKHSVFQGQCAYESPFGGWFGAPIGLPYPLQIEEMKWMKQTDVLRSHIKNWCGGYGAVQGYIQFTPMAIWDFYVQSKEEAILTEYYEDAKKYTCKKCFEEEERLPKTRGSWITGAEYQPSFYEHTEPKWDWRNDTEGEQQGFQRTFLYRVDECVMHLLNLQACREMAQVLEKKEDVIFFERYIDAARKSITKMLWNEEKGFFFDVDVKTQKQCVETYSYDGFMPMMKNLFGKEYHSVFQQLEQGGQFDGTFGITSVGKDCPMYWFDNCIVGPTEASLSDPHLYGCCWNGPIWPFANSLILEALGSATYTDDSLYETFQHWFSAYTELHFESGDRSTPCIVEHYRPTDGVAFSPQAEYFHSEWINLFLAYYLGIQITPDGICVKPITKEEFTLEDVCIQGKHYTISQSYVDGQLQQFVKRLTK